MYKHIVVSVFLHSPFSGGVFRYASQSGKKTYLCNEWTNSYIFGINTLSIKLSYFITVNTLLIFFLKSLQEMKHKLHYA